MRPPNQVLPETDEAYRIIAELAPVPMWTSGPDGLRSWFNRRWLDLVDRTLGQELGGGWLDSVHPADVERCRLESSAAIERRQPFTIEYRLRRRDGAWRWIRDEGVPRHAPPDELAGYVGACTDITEPVDSSQALREVEERYRTLVESLPHLVWTCKPDGWCDYLSRQWVEYTGRPEEEQHGYGWAEQLHPDDRERVQAEWTEATVRGDHFDIEFRIRNGAGVYRWFKTRAVPLRDAGGHIVKWFGSNTDFEDHKVAERRLETQLERLNLLDQITRAIGRRQDLPSILQVVVRNVEDHLPVDFGCICLHDPGQPALTVACVGSKDEALAHELERARIDIESNGLSRCVRGEVILEGDISGIDYPFVRRLAAGGLRAMVVAPLLMESRVFGVLVAARREPDGFASGDAEFLRQLGEHVALAAHQAHLYGALQEAYDDLRATQQLVLQQERLRALGQMASGIAHDINNAISPVSIYTASLLETEPNLSRRARGYLETIQHAVDDVGATVGRMREFYREPLEPLTRAPTHLNRLVQQVLDLTRARWSDMMQQRGFVVVTTAELAPDLPPILAVESDIREALTNLVLNAIDAMPEGGSLVARTRVAAASGANGAPASVLVEIADTGVGMDEATRGRCFDPFFTTKGVRGTGLGLAMVYGTARRHDADVEIESEVGRGTTVRLSFPAAADPVAGASQGEPAPAAPPPLRILIVDDDPIILRSLQDTLEIEGHTIVTASDGRAGVDAFRAAIERRDPFEVVITDLGMPHMDGRTVASDVKRASPDTPVILLTGWGHRLLAERDVPPHVDRVLSKPPRLRELREALASCSGRPPAAAGDSKEHP